jgi:hypothetical protein
LGSFVVVFFQIKRACPRYHFFKKKHKHLL